MRRLIRKIRGAWLRLFYRKLWVRIAVILLAIVTIPVVTLGVLLIHTSQEAVRNSVLNNYKQVVSRTAEEIGLFVKRPQDLLTNTAAMLQVMYPASWKQETMLVELCLEQPVFLRAACLDAAGSEVASSEMGKQAVWDYPPETSERVMKGKSFISRVKILDNHTPFVTMAVPVKKLGQVVGALVADVDLRGMWDIVDSVRIGSTGRAFLVSDDGVLIAHQDKKRVLKNEDLKERKEVRAVLSGKVAAIELEDPVEGALISAYAPIPSLGWGIVLRQRQEEAYWFSRVMMMQSWVIIILSELAAVAASIFLGRALASPIKTLAYRVKKVAAGDLDHKIKITMRDEIGELIKAFNDMTGKLKRARERERLSAVGEAAAWIAHELKNSMVSIKTFVQLFPKRHQDQKFVDKFSQLVPEEISRWERMLKELSDFSSNGELKVAMISLEEILDNILDMMADDFAAKNISVEYRRQDEYPRIQADPEKLKQVFMNLIINSVNAMPQGGSLGVVIEWKQAEGGSLEVRLADTGNGIPEDELPKIFKPFYTTKNGGMGLGLAISRKIVLQHGGQIIVESKIGKGTVFIVRLPLMGSTRA